MEFISFSLSCRFVCFKMKMNTKMKTRMKKKMGIRMKMTLKMKMKLKIKIKMKINQCFYPDTYKMLSVSYIHDLFYYIL